MLYNLNVDHPYEYLLKIWQEVLKDVGEIDGNFLTIRKAEVSDAFILNIREEQADTFDNSDVDLMVRTHAFLNMLSPMNYAVFYGDQIMMLINIIVVISGVCEISFLTDRSFPCSKLAIRIALIKGFKKALNVLPFRRIQAKVRTDFKVGINFVEKLGFKPEGILKKFGPNNTDYTMYCLLQEGDD